MSKRVSNEESRKLLSEVIVNRLLYKPRVMSYLLGNAVDIIHRFAVVISLDFQPIIY